MADDPRLAELGKYTPEGKLTPGYGEQYLFFVGRDDVHQILLTLISAETMRFAFNMYSYDDKPINDAIMALMANPNVAVQATLDKSQSKGVTEHGILADDLAANADFYNSVIVTESATHQISHTKGGVLTAQGIGFEGSTNWSTSGQGTGIDLTLPTGEKPAPGFRAQNNTLLVFTNPVALARFSARLDVEHIQVLTRQRSASVSAAT